ncbi:hypothetical protein LAWI1_G004469 [Lachnellula willkommii]|uniref:Heterokaryon incompatibility domain-containing protein n=1 Tax=Lachnellula willkommii TaxID=215461 RepID=A0A559M7Y3_9HELO|nr:hypothetical protein LAWI1_G004469 [Lachnellula willkommii]
MDQKPIYKYKQHYTALSYTKGKALNVTVNPESALRHIRDPRRKRLISADAICVDQSNNEEKNQQVGQMSQVDDHAEHTMIFLGEATKETDIVFGSPKPATPFKEMKRNIPCENVLTQPWFTRVWVFQELIFFSRSVGAMWTATCKVVYHSRCN